MSARFQPKERLERLIEEGQHLSNPRMVIIYGESLATAWLISVDHFVSAICPMDSPYRKRLSPLIDGVDLAANNVRDGLRAITAILEAIKEDMKHGLLGTIENRIVAVAFEDFLDHAVEYANEGRHKESGVIAGVVFEDTIKRIAKIAGAEDTTRSLDQLISFLASKKLVTSNVAKRARAAAGVRTSSTHADWDDYTLQDVNHAIAITRELIEAHLDN